MARVLEGAQQMVGDRPDMAVRAARGDDDGVGQGTLALQVDEDDIARLLGVETGEDRGFEGGSDRVLVFRNGRGGGDGGGRRGVAAQSFSSR
jgi:hypothetical protein